MGIPLWGDPELKVVEALPEATGAVSGEAARLGPIGFFRDQRVVEVIFAPIDDGSGDMDYGPGSISVTVEVSFPSGNGARTARSGGYDEAAYRGVIANYEQARPWRRGRGKAARKRAGDGEMSAPLGEGEWYKITVREEGIYRLEGRDLVAAGAAPGMPVASIALYYGGGRPLSESPRAPRPQLRPVTCLVEDGGDGRLDADDAILFYGQATSRWTWDEDGRSRSFHTNPFTGDNAYWLVSDEGAVGVQPPRRDGTPVGSAQVRRTTFRSRLHVEEERASLHVAPGNIRSGKEWYWELLQRGDRRSFDVALPASASAAVDLRVGLYSNADTDALVQVAWNNVVIGTANLNMERSYVLRRSSAAESGGDGPGELEVAYVTGEGNVLFDWFEVEYERALAADEGSLIFNGEAGGETERVEYALSGFDEWPRIFAVSDSGLVEIVGATQESAAGTLSFQDGADQPARRYAVVVASELKRPTKVEARFLGGLRTRRGGADYIVITHADFLTDAQRLAEWRGTDDRFGRPPETAAIDIGEIYDDFSWGLFDPTAIRDFLSHAFETWEPAPAFVVLLGDGTYDYRNNSATSQGNWIPPYEELESTYDEWYTRVSGADDVADMAIGRLSVQTAAEAEAVVDKLIDYDRSPEFGSWQGRVLLVADDTFNADEPQRVEIFFTHDSEELAENFLPEKLDTEKLYLVEFPFEGRFKPLARDAFIRRFNDGAVLLTWVGHGNSSVFAHEHIFVLSEDLEALDNGGRLPFVYAAASQMGVFDDPDEDSVPEALLKWTRGGAIGMVAATRIGFHASNMELARNFHARLFRSGRRNVPVGLALLEAKARTDVNPENVRRYSLFGDPLTRLSLPTLGISLETPDTLKALGVVEVRGAVVGEDGSVQRGFFGQVRVQVFDSVVTRREQRRGQLLEYERPVATLFRGTFSVVEGRFAGDFPIPKDITYRGARGRIGAYAWSDRESAFGSVEGLVLAGTAEDAVTDVEGPVISIGFSGQQFSSGGFVSPRPRLEAVIGDRSGINVTGEVGHRIILTVDGRQTDVTDLFETRGDYREGGLTIDLSQLEPGAHSIRLEAWDTHNNWSEWEVTAVVAAALTIADPLFYPNPSSGEGGAFTFVLSAPAAQVRIRVFSVAGNRVVDLSAEGLLGYNQVAWQPPAGLANGSYIYRISARSEGGDASADGVIQIVR